MLELKYIRSNLEAVRASLDARGYELEVERFVTLDSRRREILRESEALRHRRKELSKEIGRILKAGGEADEITAEVGISARIKELETGLQDIDSELHNFIMAVPNIPHASVPVGATEDDNELVREWGEIRDFDFTPRPHWESGEDLGILDFARAAKITGSR